MRATPGPRAAEGAPATSRPGWLTSRAVPLTLAALVLTALCARGSAAVEPNPVTQAFGETTSARMPDPFPPTAVVTPGRASDARTGCPTLLDYRMDDLRGRPIDLCAFKGKVLLLVNTASFCGYTPQYRGLEALQERYAAAGLVVVGFPSNDFGGQEPGSNAEVQDFCEGTYGVRFPMFGKVTVRGAGQSPLFAGLTALRTPQLPSGEIAWNFEKFLLDREGRLIARFRSAVEPEAPALLSVLTRALQSS